MPNQIYTLSLHDALPISVIARLGVVRPLRRAEAARREPRDPVVQLREERRVPGFWQARRAHLAHGGLGADRKSTRLNSSHSQISYAVFCSKKKNQTIHER